jgi:hypothetical protein
VGGAPPLSPQAASADVCRRSTCFVRYEKQSFSFRNRSQLTLAIPKGHLTLHLAFLLGQEPHCLSHLGPPPFRSSSLD